MWLDNELKLIADVDWNGYKYIHSSLVGSKPLSLLLAPESKLDLHWGLYKPASAYTLAALMVCPHYKYR